MINKGVTAHFESAKIQQNVLCRYANCSVDDDYQGLNINNSKATTQTNASTEKPQLEGEQVIDLEDMWNSLEYGQTATAEKGKIRVSIMHVEQQKSDEESVCEVTDEEFEKMLADAPEKEAKTGEEGDSGEVEDLGDLWDQVDQQTVTENPTEAQQQQESSNTQTVALPSQTTPQTATESPAKADHFDLSALFSQKSQKSLNYNLSKEYLIYDYQTFVMGCFQTNVHSYFGFSESAHNRNLFHFYDLATREAIMECSIDSYDQAFLKSNAKKIKTDYEIESCLKFRLPRTGELVAAAFHKYINNGILYNIKPYNRYENTYEDPLALVEITDGFIGSNCYCNTNVYISQKYTAQPGHLKMIIGLKNGFLIANMGVTGVKSAPYNCRLENYHTNFVYLLGMVDKDKGEFIVRVGEGMSPLIAFAISIARKRYIDSFTE